MAKKEEALVGLRNAFSNRFSTKFELSFLEKKLRSLGFFVRSDTLNVNLEQISQRDFDNINPLKLNNDEISFILPYALLAGLGHQDETDGLAFLHHYIWPLFSRQRQGAFDKLSLSQKEAIWIALLVFFEDLQNADDDPSWPKRKKALYSTIYGK